MLNIISSHHKYVFNLFVLAYHGHVVGQPGQEVDFFHGLMTRPAILLTPRCQQPRRIIKASFTHRKKSS